MTRRNRVAAMLSWLLLAASPAFAVDPPCASPSAEPCTCRLGALRPLQGALGLEQVRYGAARIAERADHAWAALRADPIKVVTGPGGALFILDHHHGAGAWLLAGYTEGVCQVMPRPPFRTEAEFWAGLEADHLVRLADADGKPIGPEQLPRSLGFMPDDPYRTLAGHLRRAGGFCRAAMQLEFAEFTWADWLRTRPELPVGTVRTASASLVPAAMALVRSPAARGVPGYAGDLPPGARCPRDD